MIKQIIKYPKPLSLEYGTDVRVYDEKLFSLLDDLKDTIKENNLTALSAFEIGSYFNAIVYKDETGELIEMVNPVQISHSGECIDYETTYYYGELDAPVKRFTDISIVYEDREGKSYSQKFNGDLARTLQATLDYLFGSTFIDRLSEDEREKFEKKLSLGSNVAKEDYCPTVFKRDYLLKTINIALGFMSLLFLISLFVETNLWSYQLYSSFAVLLLQVSYFFYAQYEGKQYSACLSCSIGNIIGTTAVSFVRLSLIMIVSYFFM